MNRLLVAVLLAAAVVGAPPAAMAQDTAPAAPAAPAAQVPEPSLEEIELANKLITISGTRRPFDELLPNIAERAKTTFIRSNPQMQLGIIDVVDKVALELVDRRAELDSAFARLWAMAFTQEELEALIAFYESDVGKKLKDYQPRIMAIEMREAERWAFSISEELTRRVHEEMRTVIQTEAQSLTGESGAAPAAETPAEAPAPAQ